jgi:thymidylate kinase
VSARPNAGNTNARNADSGSATIRSAKTGSVGRGKRWVAVEGPCCAGKTTLSRGLLDRLTDVMVSHVRCFADHVGGGRFLPRPVPQSLREDYDAVEALLGIEADRVAHARATASDVVLMDRSIYTLLAHRYALQPVTGLNLLAPAQRVIACSSAPAWPDLVLYLDVPQQTIIDRNRGKFPPDSIFIHSTFNAGIRDFYKHAVDRATTAIVWLDATLEPARLVSIAEVHIRELLHTVAPET